MQKPEKKNAYRVIDSIKHRREGQKKEKETRDGGAKYLLAFETGPVVADSEHSHFS